MRWLKSLFSLNPASLTLGTICVVVVLFVVGIPLLDLIELKTYDLRFVPRGHVPPSPAVVFAEPDENSQLALLQQFGQKVDALAITDPQLADFIQESRKNADNDLALANAIKNASAAVVL